MTEHDATSASHRSECADCTALWAELDRISAEAKALPILRPSRDLWAGIEARIGGTDIVGASAPAAVPGRAPRTFHRRWMSHPAFRLATAASLLVAATAAVTWRVASGPSSGDLPVVSMADPDSPIATTEARGGGLTSAQQFRQASDEGGYAALDGEIRSLQLLVERRRAALDPRTIEVLERNLTLIDQAIAESRAALLADPESRFLAAQLARAYTSKLTLLRDSATLPAGT